MSNFSKASNLQADIFSKSIGSTKSIPKPNFLEGHRGGVLVGNVIADVMKRDIGNDNFDIDIIFYCEPNTDVRKAYTACQKSCIDVFGHNPPQGISLFFHDGRIPVVDNKRIALDIEYDGERHTMICVSFGVKIHYPVSAFYSTEALKNDFARQLSAHMMEK